MERIEFYHEWEPDYGFLSNFAGAPVLIDDLLWPTTEHYYQAQKFQDPAWRERVRQTATPGLAKELARSSDAPRRNDWDAVRDGVMLAALRAKFSQHAHLRARLLATGGALLAEHTASDSYWGDGGDGSGVNRLGQLLMQIRQEAHESVGAPNRTILEWLFSIRGIDVRCGLLFASPPPPLPLELSFDRIEGMMVGLALGDSLGNTSESMPPDERRRLYGEIRDYLPNRRADGQSVGLPSDDSQLAFWTLEQLIADRGFTPANLARRLASQPIFGMGETMREYLRNYQERKLPWWRCGVKSAGNGAIMRIAPMLIPHVRTATADLWADVALAAMITHNDSSSLAACLAFVAMLWQLLARTSPPESPWWPTTFAAVTRELEADATYTPRGGALVGTFTGTLGQFVERHLLQSYERGASTLEACNTWHSGAYLLESVPCALYILMRHAHNPEEALVRAVNDTQDNDTIAALVGAAVGALYGPDAFPTRWQRYLTGRTGANDDGRMFELLAAARSLWFGDSSTTLRQPR